MRIALALLIGWTLLTGRLPAAPAPADPSRADLVKAKLVADVASVQPGQPFTVGILLKMKPKWHVYWKNPGDAGAAPSVEWKLPDGFTAGALKFPLPVRFEQPGPIIGYGYEDEVLLTATITPPAELPPGKPVELAADVSWLVCEAVCIPGKAALSLALPAGETTAAANTELFQHWRQQLPETFHERIDQSWMIKQVGIRPGPGSEPGAATAFVVWRQRPQDLQWFPAPPALSGIENIQTNDRPEVSEFSFVLSPAPKAQADMQFLVTFTDTKGKRRGVEFGVKLPLVADQSITPSP